MKFQKGQSGNPKGRPPKERALTTLLERAGATALDINGDKVSRKRLLASLLWEAATTGKITFEPERIVVCDVDQWIGIAKFIYTQVDGPPKQSVELGGKGGGPIAVAGTLATYSVSADEAGNIFDILAEAGALAPEPNAATPDGLRTRTGGSGDIPEAGSVSASSAP